MIIRLYTIRDRKSGLYDSPFPSVNDETAKRDFAAVKALPKNVYAADDLELYYVGSVDSETGELNGIGKPVYLEGGVVVG